MHENEHEIEGRRKKNVIFFSKIKDSGESRASVKNSSNIEKLEKSDHDLKL